MGFRFYTEMILRPIATQALSETVFTSFNYTMTYDLANIRVWVHMFLSGTYFYG